MKKELVEKFTAYCRSNFNLNSALYAEPYNSMALCILDTFYSLRARYFSCTVKVRDRYVNKYMNGDKSLNTENCKELIEHIEAEGNCFNFATNVLNNRQQINKRLKAEVCYDVAQRLLSIGVNSKEEFNNFYNTNQLETALRSIKGVGTAGLNYLFMLAGDPNRCKPDIHIHHCIKDACLTDITDRECQELFTDAVNILKSDFPNMTVRLLDGIIWQKYQSMKTHKKSV